MPEPTRPLLKKLADDLKNWFTSPPSAQPRKLDIMFLEDRILYSATAMPIAEGAPLDAASFDFEAVEAALANALAEPLNIASLQAPAAEAACESSETTSHPLDSTAVENESSQASQSPSTQVRHEVAFIDANLDDLDQLLTDLQTRAGDSVQLQVVLMHADTDGILAIGNYLSASEVDFDAVHLVSHGNQSGFQLGSEWFDSATLVDRSSDLDTWRDGLAVDADLLIYGCSVAMTSGDVDWLSDLGEQLNVDVAASDDQTGTGTQGGDWNLEYRVGSIESGIVFSIDVQTDWNHLLDMTAAGSETLVNGSTANNQVTTPYGGGNLAMNSSGQYVVAWEDPRSGDADVYAKVYNADGTLLTAEFRVHAANSSAQDWSNVSMADSGNIVVTWSDNRSGTYESYMRLFSVNGTALTGETLISALSGSQDYHAVDIASDGSFVIVFQNASDSDVYFQRYNSNGVAQGSNTRVNTTTVDTQENPDIAVNNDGSFVVTWMSKNQDGSGYGMYAQRYNASGTAQGSNFILSQTTSGNQYYGTVDSDSTGNFVATWMSSDGNGDGIWARRFNSSGTALGNEFQVNTYTNGGQSSPHIDMNSSGDFIVTWQDSNGEDGSGFGIFAQQFDSAGARVGGEVHVTSTTANTQQDPTVAFSGSSAVIAWSGNGVGDTEGVFTRRFTTTNYSTLTVDTTSNTADGTTTSIAALLNNKGADGKISLREAILAVNASANGTGGADRISFSIAGTGAQTITVSGSDLAAFTQAVIIDGTTQSGYAGSPLIVINGVDTRSYGLQLDWGSDGSTIRGLAIQDFTTNAINIVTSNNTIAGNYIGTNAAGTSAASNYNGINIWSGDNNIIGGTSAADRNVISGNANLGIVITGGADSTRILGNYIGLNAAGTTAIANSIFGIYASDSVGTIIGGTSAGSRNVISGNGSVGIYFSNADNSVVYGNYIGTNAEGTSDVTGTSSNTAQSGVVLMNGSSGNQIGNTLAGATNVISGNNHYGIEIQDSTSQNNTLAGNYIGTNATGLAALGNSNGGMSFWGAGAGNKLVGNMISGNLGHGVLVGNAASGAHIQGNYIGVRLDGSTILGNSLSGIAVEGAAVNTLIGTDADGVNDTAEANTISGNHNGIVVSGVGTTGTMIYGNFIGTDASGLLAKGNTLDGVHIENGATGNYVGGATSLRRNIIAGNGQDGVQIDGESTDGNFVQNNYIGVGANGTTVMGNGGDGILISGGADNTTIGGVGLGNVIMGSRLNGIQIDGVSTGTLIYGNFIGLNASGTVISGQHSSGIMLGNGVASTTIGGTTAGQGNTITDSGWGGGFTAGISVSSTAGTGNSIVANSIFGNLGLGIDVGATGVTANDTLDPDSGANNLQNTPVMTSTTTNGTTVTVSGTLNSLASMSGMLVHFYATPASGNLSARQGKRYLGSTTVNTDASGNATFSNIALSASVAAGEVITATSTYSGNTSEFSQGVVATLSSGNSAPSGAQLVGSSDGGLAINAGAGNSTYLIAESGSALLGGRTQLTMEFQFQATAIQNEQVYTLASYTTAADGDALFLGAYKGANAEQLYLVIGGSSIVVNYDLDTLFDGNRHALSATWTQTSGAWAVYRDGVAIGSGTGLASGQMIAGGGTLVLGMDWDVGQNTQLKNSNYQFKGVLNDARIFSDVRTAAEIAASYRSELPFNESGMLANWRFEDLSTAGVTTDSVSGNNLSVGQVTQSGFSAEVPTLTMALNENSVTGTVVGSVYGTDIEREAKITALLASDSSLRYSAETDKFYRIGNSQTTFAAAQSEAVGRTLSGISGQMVTIRSAAENELVQAMGVASGGTYVWLGSSDATLEGTWRWQSGNQNGDVFWQGAAGGFSRGDYSNWLTNEPQNSEASEDAAVLSSSDGQWRDTAGVSAVVVAEWKADDVLDATHALTYSIASQSVSGAFAINSDSGVITVASGSLLNDEAQTSHTLTVRVTDGSGAYYDKVFAVSLNNMTDSDAVPTDLSSGISLNTDGGNDAYLMTSSGGSVFGGKTALTLEINYTMSSNASSESTLVSYAVPSGSDNEVRLGITSNGQIQLMINGSSAITSAAYSQLLDGNLHAIGVSWDNTHGDLAFYIDGQLVQNSTGLEVGMTLASGGTLVMGQDQDSVNGGFQANQRFSGTLYEVRVWDRAISGEQIAQNYQQLLGTVPTGLVANWRMSGFNGSSQVVDAVGGVNLSIGHATGTEFSTSTITSAWTVAENAAVGTVVGTAVVTDANNTRDIVADGLFMEAADPGAGSTHYSVGQSLGNWSVTKGSVELVDSVLEDSPRGGREVVFYDAAGGSISQTLTTEVGRQYQITFYFSGDWTAGDVTVDGRVTAGGQSLDFSTSQPNNWSLEKPGWESRTLTFTADSTSTVLTFDKLDTAVSSFILSGVQVLEVPSAVQHILSNDSTLSYDAATGKFYRLVNSAGTWMNSQSAATTSTLNGTVGQLVTIGSSYENELVWNMSRSINTNLWLGAADAATEGTWNWCSGTSTGTVFWIGGASGTLQTGKYANWIATDPNDADGSQDYGMILASTGQWGDSVQETSNAYVIEWDASEVLSNYQYALTSNPTGAFAIDANTGEITVVNSTALDYLTAPVQSLTVQVTDAAGNTYSEVMTIGVSNINDAPTFMRGDGLLNTGLATGSMDYINATYVLPNGKILAAGYSQSNGNNDFALIRYNVDGSLDTTFGGGDGMVITAVGSSSDVANSLTVLSSGKILLAGTSVMSGSNDFALVQYNADGTLDTSFGGGDGISTAGFWNSEGSSMAVQADGEIVVGGRDGSNFLVARFHSDGTVDTSFGTNGKTSVDFNGSNDIGYSLALQGDGKIVMAGAAFNGTSFDFALLRLNSNGSLDTSFDGDGKVLTDIGTASSDFGYKMTLQSDGRIVVAGWSDAAGNNDFAVVRYNSNGSLDTTFSGDGKLTTAFSTSSDLGQSVTVQADGKIVVAGQSGTSGNNFGVVRYMSDGSLDQTFNSTGKIDQTFLGSSDDRAASIVVQGDGKLLVAGTSTASGTYDFAIARYNSNGSLDMQFDLSSTLGGSVNYTEGGAAVALDSNVIVFDAELTDSDSFSGATLNLVRNAAANAEDQFMFDGSVVTVSGANVFVSGVQVGTYVFTGGQMSVAFGANATGARVNTLMQNIRYANASDAPPASVQVNWTFSDGNVASQGAGGPLTASGSVTVNISSVNDAPVMTPYSPTYNTTEGSTAFTATVATLLQSSVADVDANAVEGVAVYSISGTGGLTEYSTDGSNWISLGAVSVTESLLLRATDQVRFTPDTTNGGTLLLGYRAWDQTSGTYGTKVNASLTGGVTAFSSATDQATINTASVNDAPVLDNLGSMSLTAITEDQTSNSGQTVASVIASAGGDRITDVDNQASEGIAITATASGTGTWQYSTDNGGNWLAVGTVSNTSALLLRSTDLLRFIPDGFNGTTADISFRAWDTTTGSAGSKVTTATSGGSTAFSTSIENASITVASVNDNIGAITDFSETANTVLEDAAIGSSIGITALATDADTGSAITYSLDQNAGGRYAINSTSGVVTVAGLLDAENQYFETIVVRASSSDGSYSIQAFNISVMSVNEAPTNITIPVAVAMEDFESGATGWSNTHTVNGGGSLTTYLGGFGSEIETAEVYKDFTLSGDQTSVTIQFDFYELDSWDGEAFKIWVDGMEYLSNSFWFETLTPYAGLEVEPANSQQESDGYTNLNANAGFADEIHHFRLTINTASTDLRLGFSSSLNQPAYDESWGVDNLSIVENHASLSVAEKAQNGTSVGSLVGLDSDAGDSLTYSLTDSAGGRFAINNETGEIAVADGSLLDMASGTSHTITVRTTDLAGLMFDSNLLINLTNINDAPTAVSDIATAVEAGGAVNSTLGTNPTGNVLTNDADPDSAANGETKSVSGVAAGTVSSASGSVSSAVTGSYGSIAIAGDGSYTYTVDNSNAAVQALRTSGQTLSDVFTYTMQDAAGVTSSTQITVAIQGANDAPTAVSDAATAVEAGGTDNGTAGANPTGNVLTNDSDPDSAANGETKTVSGVAAGAVSSASGSVSSAVTGSYGSIAIAGDGSYTYTVDNSNAAVQALRSSGQTLSDIFTYTMQDAAGVTSSAQITVAIQGANDAPTSVSDTAIAVEAGGAVNSTAGTNPTGNVLTNDSDLDSAANGESKSVSGVAAGAVESASGSVSSAVTGSYGSINIAVNGSYTYTVDNSNAAVQALRTSGQSLSDVFTYTMQDAAGVTSSAQITVAIQGANDAPTAVSDTVIAVEAGGSDNGTAGANPTGNVLTNDSDLDSAANGETKTVSGVAAGTVGLASGSVASAVTGSYGSIAIAGDGSYTYTVDNSNAAVQALRTSGQTLSDIFTYTMQDAAGVTSSTQITVAIQGANDAPTAVSDTANAVEAGGTDNGTAGANPTGNVLTNDSDPDSAANGETKTVSGVAAGAVSSASGSVSSAVTGSYGSIAIAANGSYTYTVDNSNAAVQALRTSGQTLSDIFTYTMQDVAGVTSSTQITVAIQGANDAPAAVSDTAIAVETGGSDNGTAGTNPTGNVLTNDSDPDSAANGESKTVSGVAAGAVESASGSVSSAVIGSYGSIAIAANGSYSYTVDNSNAAVQALRTSGQTLSDVFTYTMQDAAGVTSSTQITVAIQGANDAPKAVSDTANAVEAGGSDSDTAGTNPTGNVLTNDTDPDSAANGETKTVSGVAAGTVGLASGSVASAVTGSYGSIAIAGDGSYTYTVDNGNAAVQSLGTPLELLQDIFTYTTTDAGGLSSTAQLTVTIQGSNDAPVGEAIESSALEYAENSGAIAITSSLSVSDVDDTNLGSAVVQLTGNYVSGEDLLSFSEQNGISGVWNATLGTLTLTGTATAAQYEAALQSVVYTNISDSPNTAARTVTFTVSDGDAESHAQSREIRIMAANDAPVETSLESSALNYTENGGPVAITSSLAITDGDDTHIASAIVAITSNYASGQDELAFSSQSGISGVWNSSTGELTLTGSATVAQYEIAMRSVTYTNHSDAPSTATRTVSFTVNDGDAISNTQARDISVASVNDAPDAQADHATAIESGGAAHSGGTNPSGNVLSNDTDVDTGDSKVVSGVAAGMVGSATGAVGQAVNGSYGSIAVAADGTYLYTVDNSNAAVESLRNSGQTLTDVFSYTATDAGGLTATTQLSITIEGRNDAPIASDDNGEAIEAGGATNGTVGSQATGNVLTNDSDVDTIANGETKAVIGAAAGSDAAITGNAGSAVTGTYGSLTVNADGNYIYTVDNGNAAVEALRLAGHTLIDVFTYKIADAAGLESLAEITITLRGANDAPIATVDFGLAVEAGGVADGTAGSPANGNVLSNDTDVDAIDHGESRAVSGVVAGVQVTSSGNVGSSVLGSFGAITILSNGEYSYSVDNSNVAVQALRTTFDTLSDVFSYTVVDTNGATGVAQITITIQGANDAPHDLAAAGLSTSENQGNGSTVGNVSHADVDAGETVGYSLVDDAEGRFAIDAITGVVTVKDGSRLDYEDASTHNIIVRVTDLAGATFDKTFTISLSDVNEFPVTTPVDQELSTNSVLENSNIGTTVGIAANSSDGDATNSSVAYSLVDDDEGRFAIDSQTGIVTVAGEIDRERDGGSRSITVRATSSDGSTAERTFAIDVIDVDEADVTVPQDSALAGNSVNENSLIGSLVGVEIVAIDSDATSSMVTYSLDDDANGSFQIDINTGIVSTAKGLNYEATNLHRITVRATSADGSFMTAVFMIAVNDINERPVSAPEVFETNYMDAVRSSASGVLANDFDPDGDVLTATLINGPSSGSLVLGADGSFVFTPTVGYVGDVTFEYTVSDGLLTSSVETVTITVTMVAVPSPSSDPASTADVSIAESGVNSTMTANNQTVNVTAVVPARGDSTAVSDPTAQNSRLLVESALQAAADLSNIADATADRSGVMETDVAADYFEFMPLTDTSSSLMTSLQSADSHSAMLRLKSAQGELLMKELANTVQVLSRLENEVLESAEVATVQGIELIAQTAIGSGVVIWVAKVSQFAAALLAASSAWTHIDPLSILNASKDGLDGKTLDAADALFEHNASRK